MSTESIELLNNQLVEAIQNGDTNGVVCLVKQGADANFRVCTDYFFGGMYLYPPLIYAVNPMCKNKLSVIHTLIEHGADVNIESEENEFNTSTTTPLINAAKFGDIDTVDLLVRNKADVNKFNNSCNTPLIVAAQIDGNPTLEYLLNHGANIDHQNKYGQTALLTAAYNNANLNLTTLLKYNPNPLIKDNDGYSAIAILEKNRNPLSNQMSSYIIKRSNYNNN